MTNYPLTFQTKATAESGIATRWVIDSMGHQAECAIPPEFEGPGGAFSPEDLFAQSLTNCFLGTFKVMAEKSKLSFQTIDLNGLLVMDRDDAKRPVMKAFTLQIKLTSPSDPVRATNLVKKAMEAGFILNSVKTSISYQLELA